MPYECEECGTIGARKNLIFEIRLCSNCHKLNKYKLICKSKVFSIYKLTQYDLLCYPIKLTEYLVNNPYYKSGPPMTLYLFTQIIEIFISKYKDLLKNILNIQEPLNNLEMTIEILNDYFKEQKYLKKQEKYYKILDKYNIKIDKNLPLWVQNKLNLANSSLEYKNIITSYIRFKNLYKLMKKEKLFEFIDHQICHKFIYQTDKTIKLIHIPKIIRFLLNKKKLVKQALKNNKINYKKYRTYINNYINTYESNIIEKTIYNDLETLINYINNLENINN